MSDDTISLNVSSASAAGAPLRRQNTDAIVQHDSPRPPQAQAAAAHRRPPVDIAEVAQRIESYLKSVNRSLEFRVDDESGRTVVSVRDGETGDLIRQFPSDEVLRLAQMAEDQTIVLLEETA
jgi:flagellar protein FlaG